MWLSLDYSVFITQYLKCKAIIAETDASYERSVVELLDSSRKKAMLWPIAAVICNT